MNLDHANKELFSALAKAQSEVENATKGSVNPHFRSRYADLAEVLNTVRPVFAANGLSITQGTSYDGSLVSVTTAVCHSGGGYITSTASCVPAKSDAQGIGAATTYLRRYALAGLTGVAQEDDDGQSAAHSKPAMASNPQLDEFWAKAEDVGANEADLLKYLGAQNRNLTLEQYNRGMAALAKKAAKKPAEPVEPVKPKKASDKLADLIESAPEGGEG